ncbi:Uncharacterised protein [Legionella pneumophila]|uniref:hypothetical protein n=1 Tax=Legionella pneumophila TaxID=446 RepID=UPI0007707D70|nr:hypothetical protein [Legionella pneumophila]CZJ14446.1 Uncharacterised protein [Legionella pneumophila]
MLTTKPKRIAPVKKIPALYPDAFTESSIRWLIFNEHQNGFSRCIRRIGKKVLLDLDQFESWIDEQSQGGSR